MSCFIASDHRTVATLATVDAATAAAAATAADDDGRLCVCV